MTSAVRSKLVCGLVAAIFGAAPWSLAHAIQFELDYGDGVTGTLNTVLTAGAGIRVQGRSQDLVGKANNNPNACGLQPAVSPSPLPGLPANRRQNQSCQGLFKDQIHPAQALAAQRGQATPNADDGNLNYDKGDLTQAVFKATQDLSLKYGEDWGFFGKWIYFYDFVNNDFTEFHPNRITKENAPRTGNNMGSNSVFGKQYGPGEVVRNKRTDGETLRQIGTDLQMLDFYVYGKLPFYGDKQLTFKLGRQAISWGESTVLVINSVNQVNPVNANNLFRVGFDLSELFVPTNMLYLTFEPFENTTVEALYGLEWKPLEIPAPGSYFSFVDIGTNNAINNASISFGGPAEDPDTCGTVYNPDSGCGVPLDNPLSGLTNTSTTIRRLEDKEPSNFSQFGFSVKYFAEWLGNGTELGFYFLNYASKLPYLSVYATNPSCARAENPDNPLGRDVKNGVELLLACPDLPVTHPTNPTTVPRNEALGVGGGPQFATSNAVPIDTVKFQFEYPENIQMYGVSFNTTAGDLSFQGEVAFRPNLPLQVDTEDLVFAALNPMLTRCRRDSPCLSSTSGIGGGPAGGELVYGPSDYNEYPGQRPAFAGDTFDLLIGAGVDSARSFPSFVNKFRGVPAGETVPNSYIRGYERFAVWQGNLGATYVQGATDNFFGADQVIWLFEAGAQYVPDLPHVSQLQIDAPGTYYHASAGADGSMTGDYDQDCAHTEDCNFGADGLRFNPHQEDARNYADDLSYGYAIVNLTRYESVFPGISFQPITIWKHDVQGTSVDVASQFLEGRKNAIFLFETRYKEALSLNLGYTWFFGGGKQNLLRDRDQALAYVKYQF